MDLFGAEEKEKEEEKNDPYNSEPPSGEDDSISSQEYTSRFTKKLDIDGDKVTVTYERSINDHNECMTKEFDNEEEASCFYNNLSFEAQGEKPQLEIIDMEPIVMGGVTISSKTRPTDDLLVISDALDKEGKPSIADIVFNIARKISHLSKFK